MSNSLAPCSGLCSKKKKKEKKRICYESDGNIIAAVVQLLLSSLYRGHFKKGNLHTLVHIVRCTV